MKNKMDVYSAVSTLEDHGDCGCSLCQWAKAVISDPKNSQELEMICQFKVRKQARERG